MHPPRPCAQCGELVTYSGRGRPRMWCSDNCRKRAFEVGSRVETVVVEREVVRTERITPQAQIERMLDDPETAALLLRVIAHRWRHQGVAGSATDRRTMAPVLAEMWQNFHAGNEHKPAPAPPPKLPTVAAEYRAAVEKVLSSPRSIAAVLNRVKEMLDNNELADTSANTPIFQAIVGLTGWLRHIR